MGTLLNKLPRTSVNRRRLLTMCLIAFYFNSCQTIYITEKTKLVNLNKGNSKRVLIVGYNQVTVNEFENTYNSMFKDDKQFVRNFTGKLEWCLNNEKIFDTINNDNSEGWNVKLIMSGATNIQPKDSIYYANNFDYLIFISDFEITNHYNYYTIVGSGGFSESSGKTEDCVIKAKVEIFDTSKHILLGEFITGGKGHVYLLQFKSALSKALDNAVIHSAKYISEGKTKF